MMVLGRLGLVVELLLGRSEVYKPSTWHLDADVQLRLFLSIVLLDGVDEGVHAASVDGFPARSCTLRRAWPATSAANSRGPGCDSIRK